MSRQLAHICYAVCMFGAILHLTPAAAIPAFSVERMAADSDVIAVVDVLDVQRRSSTTIHVGDAIVPAESYVATAAVKHRIKGGPAGQIRIDYAVSPAVLYRGVPLGLRLVFLRSAGERFTFTDPTEPSLPAVLKGGDIGPSGPAMPEQIVHELARVIASPHATAQDKMSVLIRAYAIPKDSLPFLSALKVGLTVTSDADLRARMIAALLARGDLSELHVAQQLIASPTSTAEQRGLLLYAISQGVKDSKAVPDLNLLLNSGDVMSRRAAAEALWHVADPSSRDALVRALGDSDRTVRYYTVRALADIAGQPDWGPGEGEFQDHESRYLEHWRQWASSL